jgi:peptidoglycan hydrolase CwlO-like protein
MNEDLIESIDALTEAVRNLSGYIQDLDRSFTTTDGKLNYLSERLSESTKAVDKLTGEINGLRFK